MHSFLLQRYTFCHMSVNIIFDILILAYQRYFVLQGGFLKPFMRNGGGGGGGR